MIGGGGWAVSVRVMGIEPRTLHILGKYSPTELCSQPLVFEIVSAFKVLGLQICSTLMANLHYQLDRV